MQSVTSHPDVFYFSCLRRLRQLADRDREVVGEAARERIRSVEEAGKMMEWDWGSERVAVAESCPPSRVAGERAGSGSSSEAVHARWICLDSCPLLDLVL